MSAFKVCEENLRVKKVLFLTDGPFYDEIEIIRDGSVIEADDTHKVVMIDYAVGGNPYRDEVPYDKLVAIFAFDNDTPEIEIGTYYARLIDLRTVKAAT